LILMDIQLPGLDGLEITRRLKADPTTRDIVVVAVTAYAMKGDREKALRAGCDGYIAKPLDPIQLPIQVEQYLGQTPTAPRSEPKISPQRDHVVWQDILVPPKVPEPDDRATILVVEDNPTTRKMFRVALESAGYRVIEAHDARTALGVVARSPLALIIQDLIL